MGKKRKASGRSAQPTGPKAVDPKDARLGPITTYEDIADSEDEYFINRDAIMLEDEPGSKRRRKDDDIELSDEEILGYSDDDSDESDEEVATKPASRRNGKKKTSQDSDEEAEQDAEEGDSGWWGSSKGEYYNADNIETEADAAEEEVEAKRLQQKKLSKMTDEDFIFDGDEWLAETAEPEDTNDTVTEVLKDVEISEDMSPTDRLRLLQSRYPEFQYLVKEFQESQPLLLELKEGAKRAPEASIEVVKYWVLGCYVATLASYFAILTSPARGSTEKKKALDPSELRDHEVMETLIACRDTWNRVKDLTSLKSAQSVLAPAMDVDSILPDHIDEGILKAKKKTAKTKADMEDKKSKKQKKKDAEKAKAIKDSVADLYDLPIGRASSKPKSKSQDAVNDNGDDISDFGEEETLDARTASEKAARKKSLKFYTSQIVQKANKRAGAGRDAGGDMDIPHRERLRDRQARLLAEAEKRGRKDSKHGADLGDDSDDDDTRAADAIRDNENDYYDMVANASKDKREDKAARYAAYAAASKADRVVEQEEIAEDGKRKINYTIEKNKGLAPKRKKDVRNPRVKKRNQFEAKKKKLNSMKATWKGGEPKGGYQGELSGINTGVIKSTRL